jgi:hypothetical protein
MFHQTYRGDAVEDFVLALPIYSDMYDPHQHFGRCISILVEWYWQVTLGSGARAQSAFISVVMLLSSDPSACVDSNPQHLLS